MPTLGVGRSTPFSQPSNYRTSFNHRFREEAPYDPTKQTKVKCPYCGVWARKGQDCSLCGTRVPGAAPQLSNHQRRSQSPSASQQRPSTASRMGATSPGASRTWSDQNGGFNSARVTLHDSAAPSNSGRFNSGGAAASSFHADGAATPPASSHRLAHAEPTPSAAQMSRVGAMVDRSLGPSSQVKKVKCSYCGIWVPVGKICSLCRTQA